MKYLKEKFRVKHNFSPSYFILYHPPAGIIYPDNTNYKKIRGYYSDIWLLIEADGSMSFDVILFKNCFHSMKEFLNEKFGIKTFEQMLADDRLYEDAFGGAVSYVSFETHIQKEYQHITLFKLIESPDGFAEWLYELYRTNGKPY